MRDFKTESKRVLDMMINSVYTNREIFLRELISNASDALDKLYFTTRGGEGAPPLEELKITITADKENRTLTVTDNGAGMSETGLAENLGTIAHSGTGLFRDENKGSEDAPEIIGQFGVGFYSAFMVAKKVEVTSRKYGADKTFLWVSEGAEGFEITEAGGAFERGTAVKLYLKDDGEDDKYGNWLETYAIRGLVKKYSDYIRYPVVMDGETLNSMTPLWRRAKSELTDEDYANFYKDKFGDWEDPLLTVHYKTEGAVTYAALLFIPSSTPPGYYSKEYKKGLQLYANGVLISDKTEELLSDRFGFVKGLVDSADVSLNISREVLQHDRQMRAMHRNIEKKVLSELEKLLKDDREKYEKFFTAFGLQIKYGLYSGYGVEGTELKDLLLFRSLKEEKLLTLKEYTENLAEGQDKIFYVCAETPAKASLLPQTEGVLAKGYDILVLSDDVDEFTLKMLREYEGKEFSSVSAGETPLDDAEKESVKAKSEENSELLKALKDALGGKVADVKISARLKKRPVCLSSEGELSLDMEKVLNAMPVPESKGVKARRVLELNAEHAVFSALKARAGDADKLKDYAELLLAQALLIEGLSPEDPAALSELICGLMV